MVNVDNVYQKVLALANKEQRGYITPQEFNLFASKAQMEIINDYFFKIRTAHLKPKNLSESFDDIEILKEKLNYLRKVTTGNPSGSGEEYSADLGIPYSKYKFFQSPSADLYKIGSIIYAGNDINGMEKGTEIVEVDRPTLSHMLRVPLMRPTHDNPVYFVEETDSPNDPSVTSSSSSVINIRVYPKAHESQYASLQIKMEYYRRPKEPNWGYVVVNQKPLYNFNTSKDFELHPMEEENLVNKILSLAGIALEKPQLPQTTLALHQQTKQEQNS